MIGVYLGIVQKFYLTSSFELTKFDKEYALLYCYSLMLKHLVFK